MNSIDALIFDYDGVVADTEPSYWRAWAEVLAKRGIEFTWDQYCEIGRGVHDAQMIETLGRHVTDPSLLSGVVEQFALRVRGMQDKCFNAPPIPKVTIELLQSLKSFRLGLVTSSAKSDVEPVLQAAGVFTCFGALVFGDDVEHHKPAPDPYLLIGSRLGVKTGLVFEDSASGIASARKAGFLVIPVTEPAELPGIVHRAIKDYGVSLIRRTTGG